MRFSVLVTAGPQRPAALTGLRTVEAVLRSRHQLHCVFFYGEGVHLANRLARRDDDAVCVPRDWQRLVETRALPAVVCVGAALRRGVTDAAEAHRAGLHGDNLAPGFRLAGLGDWVEALRGSERVVHFG
ncbi:sulfurtransferase complex subunit TusD [Alloalcanivorax mobilis]|uniref:sulfurtransferase complex subunit TusD n=1 Tax=Alloalcanivorax mobilis TaxID=2019569 RepID=UPI000C78C5A3|nr:sulfurtransferase complex subunit TusD [Alloalcanivorax mobilis]